MKKLRNLALFLILVGGASFFAAPRRLSHQVVFAKDLVDGTVKPNDGDVVTVLGRIRVTVVRRRGRGTRIPGSESITNRGIWVGSKPWFYRVYRLYDPSIILPATSPLPSSYYSQGILAIQPLDSTSLLPRDGVTVRVTGIWDDNNVVLWLKSFEEVR
jgi:hypothetical protein